MKRILLILMAGVFAMSARSQQTNSLESAPRLHNPEAMSAPGWDGSVNISYDAPAATRFLGNHLADSASYTFNLGLGRQIDLNQKWFVHLGLASDNFFLGTVSGAPIPATIHTLHLNTGLGFHLNEQWTLNAFVFPSLYRLDGIGNGDVGIAGGVMATYKPGNSLIWSFGIIAAPDSDLKVLPAAGVRWFINDHSMLEVGFPKTRYSYRMDSKWTLFTGGDFSGTTFRTSDSLGTQNNATQFNHALATYRDVRLGAGVSYNIVRGLRAELEAGCSVYRRIDYTRIGQTVDFNPAPYVHLGLNSRF